LCSGSWPLVRAVVLLTDEAFAIWQERTEALLHAHWDRAIIGLRSCAGSCWRSRRACTGLLQRRIRCRRRRQRPWMAVMSRRTSCPGFERRGAPARSGSRGRRQPADYPRADDHPAIEPPWLHGCVDVPASGDLL
jgi:hypothetical protein